MSTAVRRGRSAWFWMHCGRIRPTTTRCWGCTCRFGPDRVQDFNRRNGLKLIIRAHECVQHGYEYFAAGQLLTVFSATNYCNQYNNDGAMVVLVKDDRTGEVVEHAQVIKSGTVDTSHGWNDQQFRAPSPMRRADNGRDSG